MKRIRLLAAALLALTSIAFGATLTPIQLLNPAGSAAGQSIVSTGPSSAPAWGSSSLAPIGANTVLGNRTGSTATPTAVSVSNCVGSSSALVYTAGSGFGCNATINAVTLGGATFSAPGPIGSVSTSSGAFSSLSTPSATIGGGTINNTSIGATSASTGAFTTLSASGTLTGFPGRLINVRQFTSTGTYTPTAGTNAIIVEVQSAAGGSGGNAATGAGQNAASSGGGSGNYARVYVTSAFSGVTITIGTVGAAGTAGGAGGGAAATSFGSIVSCPGGTGGAAGSAISALGQSSGGAGQQPTACTIAGASTLVTYAGAGTGPGAVFGVGNFVLASGGASSAMGMGGNPSGGTTCNSGTGFGSGPSGIISLASTAAVVGCAGRPAVVVIYEFS